MQIYRKSISFFDISDKLKQIFTFMLVDCNFKALLSFDIVKVGCQKIDQDISYTYYTTIFVLVNSPFTGM